MKKKKGKKKKWLLIIGVVIVVVVLVVLNMSQSGRGLVSVQTKKIGKADVLSVVSGSGTVQPKTKVNITAEVTAEVFGLDVKEGDYVNRRQVLIRLDTLQAQKDMESALYAANELEARLEGARITLDRYKDEYERQSQLYEKKLTSEQAYKDAFYTFKSQEANYSALNEQKRAAFSRLDKAQDNLSKTTITAPMDGTITLVDVEVGEIAQAQTAFTQGRTLMIISDLSEFEVEVEIDETDIADLEMAQSAQIEIDAFPDTTFEGRVVEIGNTAITTGYGSSDQSTNFRVKVVLVNAHPKIRPGMSSTVDITTSEHKDVLTVPIQALVMREFDPDSLKETPPETDTEEGNVAVASTASDDAKETEVEGDDSKKKVDKKGVFVNRDGLARFVEVTTGINDQQNYEVLGGLEEGDEVITGSFRTLRTIKDSTTIKVENRQTGGESTQ
jgi:HlyD family secretion protein